MSIIACRVTAARDHENADSLRVYQVEAPGVESTQIIANKTNVYQVGDVVAAALVGTTTAAGEKIEKAKIRGVLSFGMLLGKTDAEPGADLTDAMGATHTEKKVDESQGVVEEANWPRYTSLDGFLRIRDEIMAVPEVVVTEKIHGSNARVGFHNGRRFLVGTHTSRVVDSRMASGAWPEGHLIRKTLEWVEREGLRNRIALFQERHPEVNSLALYGEICGFKCSDLHYGATGTEVRLFCEVAIDGRFLGYDAAREVLERMFPDLDDDWLVPVLYRGKPDLAVFKTLRDQVSTHAARNGATQISEGVVIRPTKETLSKVTLNRLIGKYKSPLYEERKSLRDKDPEQLPVYVSAYDLLADFVTDERIRHVLSRMEASGVVLEKRHIRDVGNFLYADIVKESVGEWPAGSENLDEGTLRRWAFDLAGESIARLIDERKAP